MFFSRLIVMHHSLITIVFVIYRGYLGLIAQSDLCWPGTSLH